METPQALEPLASWLNENGLPREAHGWHHIFEAANTRIEALGLEHFFCTAHIHRHLFAPRWFLVGKLVWDQRLGLLPEAESQDFREQFGLRTLNIRAQQHVNFFQGRDVHRLALTFEVTAHGDYTEDTPFLVSGHTRCPAPQAGSAFCTPRRGRSV